MRYFFLIFLFYSSFSLSKDAIVVDHRRISDFGLMELSGIQKASELKLIFRHASVGAQINLGLDCLQGTRTNPKKCQNFPLYKYDRRNWLFQAKEVTMDGKGKSRTLFPLLNPK